MTERIGFIGLGKLGTPMAANLLESGYELLVYNRTAAKAQPLVQRGAVLAATPTDAIPTGGIVVSVLWDSDAVESLVQTEGFFERLRGGVHICMCTGSPQAAQRLASLHAAHGSEFVEAPVFGRPEAAAARQLWIPVTGSIAAKQRVSPILTAMGAQGVFDFGEEPGAATVVKLLGNFLIISAARSLKEGLSIAERSGVDVGKAVEMLTQTLFNAPIYRSYGKMIADKVTPFAQSRIPAKDLALFATLASESQLENPIASTLIGLESAGIS